MQYVPAILDTLYLRRERSSGLEQTEVVGVSRATGKLWESLWILKEDKFLGECKRKASPEVVAH